MRLPGEKSTSLYDCSKWERLAAFQDAVKNAGPTVDSFDEILASQRMSIALRDARLALMVACNQPATKPTPAEAKEDRRVEELITA